ncbi:unnamed protein product [Euphydryas editha]|uniref:Uncharacterized protein n=1 Tax=Euphydryas editha TaxID=104508 RepID=A0AAU9V4C9_EUPED|nr:unnamed protein product [Euphydryas editha]
MDDSQAITRATVRKVYESIMLALSPPKGTPATTQAGPSKRFLSPEDMAAQKKPRRQQAKQCARINLNAASELNFDFGATEPGTTGVSDFRMPCSTDEDDGAQPSGLTQSSPRELLAVADKAARNIGDTIKSPIAKLNKGDSANVTRELSYILEVVSHLALALVESEKSVDASKARATVLQSCLEVEKTRSQNWYDHEVESVSSANRCSVHQTGKEHCAADTWVEKGGGQK